MPISDKTRKRLWAKSGNRCAISKIELIINPTEEINESIIGEECHICASNPKGPRYDSRLSATEVDDYNNFILLSRNYHKIVDDNPAAFTPERLQAIKKSHEDWVRNVLEFGIRNIKSTKYPDSTISLLTRILTGSQLLNLLSRAHGYDFDNDELHDNFEVELVGTFLQNAHDYGEIMSDMESAERVRTKFFLSEQLNVLENHGFWVFGNIASKKMKFFNKVVNLSILVMRVLRANNSEIIILNIDSSNVEIS